MPAPLLGTSTRYRLARIAALVLGSLVFLYACERSRSSLLSDVWGELLLAAGLGIAGIAAAWFEITLSNRTAAASDKSGKVDKSDEFRFETDNRTIRIRIAPSGNLVFHGREFSDTGDSHEWSWTYRPATFPAVRTALGGGEGELLALLAEVVPHLDRPARRDPGAWVRAHGIDATYREKGDNPSRATRKLPILKRGLPRPAETGARPANGPARADLQLGAPDHAPVEPRGASRTVNDGEVDHEDTEDTAAPGRAKGLLARVPRALPGPLGRLRSGRGDEHDEADHLDSDLDDPDEDDLDDPDLDTADARPGEFDSYPEHPDADDGLDSGARARVDVGAPVARSNRGRRRRPVDERREDYDDYRDYDVRYEYGESAERRRPSGDRGAAADRRDAGREPKPPARPDRARSGSRGPDAVASGNRPDTGPQRRSARADDSDRRAMRSDRAGASRSGDRSRGDDGPGHLHRRPVRDDSARPESPGRRDTSAFRDEPLDRSRPPTGPRPSTSGDPAEREAHRRRGAEPRAQSPTSGRGDTTARRDRTARAEPGRGDTPGHGVAARRAAEGRSPTRPAPGRQTGRDRTDPPGRNGTGARPDPMARPAATARDEGFAHRDDLAPPRREPARPGPGDDRRQRDDRGRRGPGPQSPRPEHGRAPHPPSTEFDGIGSRRRRDPDPLPGAGRGARGEIATPPQATPPAGVRAERRDGAFAALRAGRGAHSGEIPSTPAESVERPDPFAEVSEERVRLSPPTDAATGIETGPGPTPPVFRDGGTSEHDGARESSRQRLVDDIAGLFADDPPRPEEPAPRRRRYREDDHSVGPDADPGVFSPAVASADSGTGESDSGRNGRSRRARHSAPDDSGDRTSYGSAGRHRPRHGR